jgi:hypothetical protein
MTTRLKSQLAAARSAVAAAAESIESLRSSITALKAERETVASAPLPLPEALDALRAHLDHLITAAGPDLAGLAHAAASAPLNRPSSRRSVIRCSC